MATTVSAEDIFQNWSTTNDLFNDPLDVMDEPVPHVHCGSHDAYELFGADYLCEDCLTLISKVLSKLQCVITPDVNGDISVLS